MSKATIFIYIANHANKGEIALYCRSLGVTAQGFKKFLKQGNKPYKFAKLLANINKIIEEVVYNATYGKQRMYEKLVQDYDCLHCYNTLSKVRRENGLLRKEMHQKD